MIIKDIEDIRILTLEKSVGVIEIPISVLIDIIAEFDEAGREAEFYRFNFNEAMTCIEKHLNKTQPIEKSEMR